MGENLKGRDYLKDLDVAKKVILKCLLKQIGSEGVGWINLAQ